MASEFPRSPRLIKGALVVFETPAPVPTNLIVFQYNPESMTRSLQSLSANGAQGAQQGSGDTQPMLPPVETFQLAIDLDAADQLETGDAVARAVGLHPTLAALELLLSPSSIGLLLNAALANAGSALLSPPQAPLVLLVWGPLRVVPVRVTSLSINETAFDQLLNPIQAKVTLGLRALSLPELFQAGVPWNALGVVNVVAKEVLARMNAVSAAVEVTASISL